jgi:hypothetical protein
LTAPGGVVILSQMHVRVTGDRWSGCTATFRHGVIACALALMAMFASVGRASVVAALSLDDLVRQSDVIALGTVESLAVSRDARDRIVTDAVLRVDRSWKGSAARGSTVTVRRLGGTMDGLSMQIAGEPALVAGARIFVFGRRSTQGNYLRPVGMAQGVLRVTASADGSTTVSPSNGGLSLVRRDQGGVLRPSAPAVAGPVTLESMDALVRDAVEATRAR